jgi:hypothetical protein
MGYILTIDNFYEDPDEIRNAALKFYEYFPPRTKPKNEPTSRVLDGYKSRSDLENEIEYVDGWRGYRTEIGEAPDKVKNPIVNSVCEYYSLIPEDYELELYFHCSGEETKKTCQPSFEEFKYHRDLLSTYAGVIYMHPNPPPNSGTTIIDPNTNEKIHIENVYNRLVCYPSNVLHGPTDLFGCDLETGRLTLTFFFVDTEKYEDKKIKLENRRPRVTTLSDILERNPNFNINDDKKFL